MSGRWSEAGLRVGQIPRSNGAIDCLHVVVYVIGLGFERLERLVRLRRTWTKHRQNIAKYSQTSQT